MDLFWNAGQRDTINGVDLLGVRQVDQDLEQIWAVAVTTVAGRARYLSLLTWTIAEYYERILAASDGRATFDWDAFKRISGRLESITLAATVSAGGSKDLGVMGRRNYLMELEHLTSHRSIDLSEISRLALHLTYYGPCRGFGLLQDGPSAERPIQIPPAGQALHAARNAATKGARLVDAVFLGGKVDHEDFVRERHLFDLNALTGDAATNERELLQAAFRRSEKFSETMGWIFRSLAAAPRSPGQLMKWNYETCVASPAEPGRLELAFCELELRRRVHFALELLLSATTLTLNDHEAVTLPNIVDQWQDARLSSDDVVGTTMWSLTHSLATFIAQAGPRSFEGAWIAPRDIRDASGGQQALYAVALFLACERQSRHLRVAGWIPDRRSAVDKVFARLGADANRPLRDVLVELVREHVVGRHLEVTLGKMGRGMGCSLRFYPEGAALRPLVTAARAGFSALRLRNVLATLADIGLLARGDDATFLVTTAGARFHTELRG
ncbi:MAG: hypothetical protein IPO88_00060 [Nannocystis sp.]|uniref:hypothetical protein n=1 Tax=Nannocystis sp. TaxID=1962667 RepID=UPI0024221AB0|nr:hypothetical protein [Nannocystis sp.]MBK9751895.1 hypothetical protein [Nannocystis sp.]